MEGSSCTTTEGTRSLFGGAVTCYIPHGFVDISDFRQVPSHQECWAESSGRLLVIEILDYQLSVNDNAAGEFFFKDLAESNGISAQDDMRYIPLEDQKYVMQTFPNEAVYCFGKGYQKIVKEREFDVFGNRRRKQEEANWVTIELGLIRLRNVETDLLVTLSIPSASNPPENTTTTSDLFQSIFSSLRIRDWGLFG